MVGVVAERAIVVVAPPRTGMVVFDPAELLGGFVVATDPAFVVTVVLDVRSLERSTVFGIDDPATELLDGASSTSLVVDGAELDGAELDGAEVPGTVVAAVVGVASSELDPPLSEPPDEEPDPPEEPEPPDVEPEPPGVEPEPFDPEEPEPPDDDAAIVVTEPPPEPFSAHEAEADATICALIMSDTAIARADL